MSLCCAVKLQTLGSKKDTGQKRLYLSLAMENGPFTDKDHDFPVENGDFPIDVGKTW